MILVSKSWFAALAMSTFLTPAQESEEEVEPSLTELSEVPDPVPWLLPVLPVLPVLPPVLPELPVPPLPPLDPPAVPPPSDPECKKVMSALSIHLTEIKIGVLLLEA